MRQPEVSPTLSETISPQNLPLAVGYKVHVRKTTVRDEAELRRAEILAIRSSHSQQGSLEYYVHYVDFNKRLDEWISSDKIDMSRGVEYLAEDSGVASPLPARSKGKALASSSHPRSKQAKRDRSKGGSLLAKAVSTASLTTANETEALMLAPRRRGRPPSMSGTSTPLKVLPPTMVDELDAGIDVMDVDSTVPSTPQNENEEDDDLEIGGTTDLTKQPVLTRDEEIEKLRHGGSMAQSHHEVVRVKNLNKIRIAEYEVDTWYFSPYAQEFAGIDVLQLCEFCLTPFGSEFQIARHRHKCTLQHPPGNEIYRSTHDGLSFFEIDGRKQRTYCRNLCLLSKLFLDHKTLYYDITPFMFYILCRIDATGAHLIGYFSKEKESADNYNVACILTLPQHQRKGYGRLLIDFSYALSKAEGKLGSPEKPLSDLGLLGYRAYWTEVIVERLIAQRHSETSIDDIAHSTGIISQDVMHTLQYIDALKYYRGQHVIVLSDKVVQNHNRLKRKKNRLRVHTHLLDWEPPKFAPSQLRYL